MTIMTDPPKASFRLSMLLYDSRYRSMTIQIIALIGVLLAVGWLVSNAMSNLATLGKPVQFRFLFEPASYDINQRLIDYDSRDSHFRAAVVGLMNTLLVAFLGCVAATFPRCHDRRAAPVEKLVGFAPDGGLCRKPAQRPCVALDRFDHGHFNRDNASTARL